MASIEKFNFVILLLGALYFAAVTQAFHETVRVKIKNGDEIIELNWKRTAQHLANRNVPVWYAERNEGLRFIPQIFAKIGQFIMYHDVEKSSAVVYFPKFNCFYGVIDTRFYISELPLSYNTPDIMVYDVGGRYVHARDKNGEFFHDDQGVPLPQLFTNDQIEYVNSIIDSAGNTQNSGDQTAHLNSAEPRVLSTKILYPEILVFVTNDIFTTFTRMNAQNGACMLLLYYITYFNAIDMMFAKLATDHIAIHINIAGLVIETENNVFPYTIKQYRRQESVTHRLHADELLSNFPRYIKKYGDTFVEDSFDFYFISTGYEMGPDVVPNYGKSSSPFNVYTSRSLRKSQEKMLGSVVYRKGVLNDYIIASSQIAQLMNIRHDPEDGGLNNNNRPCRGIMQRRKTYCSNCLTWSRNSQRYLENYIWFDFSHCFLLNYPRSLHPYGQPVSTIAPEDQCMCYEYSRDTLNPFYIMSIPENNCGKPMQCSYIQDVWTNTPLPIDGTPCGGYNKVCWRKKCVAAGTSYNGDNPDESRPQVKRLRLSTESSRK